MITRLDFEKKQILIYNPKKGDKLSYINDNIAIKDVDGKIKFQSTCYQLFAIIIIGNISITSGVIMRSQKFKYSICLMNNNLKAYHMINGHMEGNTYLHKRQYQYEGLEIAKWIIKNKILNQRKALNQIRNKVPSVKEAIIKLDNHIEKLNSTDIYDLQSLLGVEGSASRVYFSQIFIGCGKWNGRKPRVKNDYINAALDIGYTILFNFIDALLQLFGFDVYQGVLHRSFYMRKSLACDIMEPFRPMIDWKLRVAIKLSQCKEDDFELINNQWVLKYKMNTHYTTFFTQEILKNRLEIFDYVQSYYRAFMKNKKITEYPRWDM